MNSNDIAQIITTHVIFQQSRCCDLNNWQANKEILSV